MIDLSEVLSIHLILIEKFGGTSGVRDKELLDSQSTGHLRPSTARNFIPAVPKNQRH